MLRAASQGPADEARGSAVGKGEYVGCFHRVGGTHRTARDVDATEVEAQPPVAIIERTVHELVGARLLRGLGECTARAVARGADTPQEVVHACRAHDTDSARAAEVRGEEVGDGAGDGGGITLSIIRDASDGDRPRRWIRCEACPAHGQRT